MAKGQKTCPKCLKAWGPRKKKCDCGFDFPIKYAPEKAAARRAAAVVKKVEKTGPPLIFAYGPEHKKDWPELPQKLNPTTFTEWLKKVKEYPVRLQFGWGYYSMSAVRQYLSSKLKKKDFDVVEVWLNAKWERDPRELIATVWRTNKWFSR